MKIIMLEGVEVGTHGLKVQGQVWDAPEGLGQQLVRQGKASPYESTSPSTILSPPRPRRTPKGDSEV